jgi:hypothetical protein
MIIKSLAPETVANTTANSYAGATLLRLFNSSNTPFLITRSNSTVNVSSITLGPNAEMFMEKEPTEFLQSNTATGVIFCAQVAYKSPT